MSRTLSIPAQDYGQAYLFALNIIEAEAKDLVDKPNAPERLLGIPLNPDFACLLYTSPSPRDQRGSRMPSSA